MINQRLQSLEAIIGRLSDHLDQGQNKHIQIKTPSLTTTGSISDDSDSEKASGYSTTPSSVTATASNSLVIPSSKDEDNLTGEIGAGSLSPLSGLETISQTSTGDAPATKHAIATKDPQQDLPTSCCMHLRQTLGIHTAYSIFSKASLTWLRGKFKNETLLVPLKNLPLLFDNILKTSTDNWVHTPTREIIASTNNFGYFPSSSKLVFEILDSFYHENYFFPHLLDLDLVKRLFTLYYTYNNPVDATQNTYRFKYSELILMNSTLAICLSSKSNHQKPNGANLEVLNMLSQDDLYNLKEDFFNNAICYYEKISVMNEGIRTVQCLALMIVFVESHYASDFHLVYMITSVMIRYAQDLGLHKIRARRLSQKHFKLQPSSLEEDLGERLWCFCEFMDMCNCYRIGKSPLIKSEDICSYSGEPVDQYRIPLRMYKSNQLASPSTDLNDFVLNICKEQGIGYYHNYFYTVLKRIERKSYSLIFSPDAIIENRNINLFYKRINNINSTLADLARCMDPGVRPKLPLPEYQFNDHYRANKLLKPLSNVNSLQEYYPLFLLNLNFLCHFMLINRSIIYLESVLDPEHQTTIKYHLDLSAVAAREILKLALGVQITKSSSLMLGWTTFPIFEGFSTLLSCCVCAADPKETVSEEGPCIPSFKDRTEQLTKDCKLMIEVAQKFFCFRLHLPGCDDWVSAFKKEQKLVTYDLIVTILLRLLLTFVSTKTGITFPDHNLEEHLNSVESVYPQLFRDDIEQVKSFRFLLQDSYNQTGGGYRRLEPTLANIINRTNSSMNGDDTDKLPAFNSQSPPSLFNEDDYNFTALLYSQTFNLPNFFHDL